jgi:LEA14-like dessication related protein
MSRAVNAIVIGVALFVLLAGSLWYVMVVREPTRIESQTERMWDSQAGDHLLAHVQFHNPYDYDVRLEGYEYRYVVNEQRLGGNLSDEKLTIPAHQSATIEISQALPPKAFVEWWKNHTAQGERSTAQLDGHAVFSLSEKNTTIAFGYKETFETHIADSLGHLDVCKGARGVCYAGAQTDWIERKGIPVLLLRAKLRNPTQERAELGDANLELAWNGLAVAAAKTKGGIIQPEGDTTAQFEMAFDAKQLAAWWPKHTQTCESSKVTVKVGIAAKFTPPEVAPSPNATRSPTPVSTSPSNTTSPSPTPTPTPSPTPTPTSPSPPPPSSPAPSTSASNPPPSSPPPSSPAPPSSGSSTPTTSSSRPGPASTTTITVNAVERAQLDRDGRAELAPLITRFVCRET